MTIEIRELIIRSVVIDDSGVSKKDDEVDRLAVAEAVEQVMDALDKTKER